MGIYDRDYYRREGPSYLDALIPSGQVCKWLIIINIVAFIVQTGTRPADQPQIDQNHVVPVLQREDEDPERLGRFTLLFYLDPAEVMHGQVWRLLTYAFLHGDFMHIFFNMLFLWWFGSELERMYGPKEFLAFYLLAAVIGGLAGVGYYLFSKTGTPGLGASGAVTALLVLFAFHFPHQVIYIFFFLPVPIWFFVLFHAASDTFLFVSSLKTSRASAGTVHLSGALFGFLYYNQHWHILSLFQSFRSFKLPRSRPRLRLYRPDDAEPVPVSTVSPNPQLDEHLEAKLDAVLEKVARFGQSSLTEAERQILLKASEIYKRKRT